MADGAKKPYLSKTLWVNALVAILALVLPGASEWIGTHGVEVSAALAGVNFLLRLISKDKISLGD